MTMLEFDLGDLLTPGARKAPLYAEVTRVLEPADLSLLATNRQVQPVQLKKLSERHHTLAKLLASGASEGDAAFAVGYQLSRVSILKNDPAFKELLTHYRDVQDANFAEFGERMAGLAKDAVLELQERLEEEPEKFSNKELMEMMTRMADRTGHGPTHKQEVNITGNLSERLAAARERAMRVISDDNLIEGEVIDD